MEQIRGGVRPYVMGGKPLPTCRTCDKETYRTFCSWTPSPELNDVCSAEEQAALLARYLEQGGPWEDYLTLSPCELWPLIKGRTLFVLGDSQGQKLWHAINCFLFEYLPPDMTRPLHLLEEGDGSPVPLQAELVDPNGRRTEPQCIPFIQGTRVCYIRAVKVGFLEETLLPMTARYARQDDVIVVQIGAWHNSPALFEQEMVLLKKFLSKYRECLPYLVWMDTAPQHFETQNGGWDELTYTPDKDKDTCKPIRNVTFDPKTHHLVADNPDHVALHGGWRNKISRATMRELGVPIVETWNASFNLHEYHVHLPDRLDCTHFCSPSAQQVWMWEIYRTLTRHLGDFQAHIARVAIGTAANVSDQEAEEEEEDARGDGGMAGGSSSVAALQRWHNRHPLTPLCQQMVDGWVPGTMQLATEDGMSDRRHREEPAGAAAQQQQQQEEEEEEKQGVEGEQQQGQQEQRKGGSSGSTVSASLSDQHKRLLEQGHHHTMQHRHRHRSF